MSDFGEESATTTTATTTVPCRRNGSSMGARVVGQSVHSFLTGVVAGNRKAASAKADARLEDALNAKSPAEAHDSRNAQQHASRAVEKSGSFINLTLAAMRISVKSRIGSCPLGKNQDAFPSVFPGRRRCDEPGRTALTVQRAATVWPLRGGARGQRSVGTNRRRSAH